MDANIATPNESEHATPGGSPGVAQSALESGFDPYPPYVFTEEDRGRWDMCVEIATAVSERYEESGVVDNVFVWTATRALFHDRTIPTGDPSHGDAPNSH